MLPVSAVISSLYRGTQCASYLHLDPVGVLYFCQPKLDILDFAWKAEIKNEIMLTLFRTISDACKRPHERVQTKKKRPSMQFYKSALFACLIF